MGGILSIFDTCHKQRKRGVSVEPPGTPEPTEGQPPTETQAEARPSLKDKLRKKLFRPSVDDSSKDEETTPQKETTEEERIERKEKEEDGGIKEDEKTTVTQNNVQKTQEPPAFDDEMFEIDKASPQMLTPPQVTQVQGVERRKPKSTAFEHFETQGILIGYGNKPKKPRVDGDEEAGDEADNEEEDDDEEPVPGGILMPGVADLKKRFTAQGTEVKVFRRLSSKDDTFASIPRNSALLKQFERAPPPRRSQARISRMQLRQRAEAQEDIFNTGAWNNNNCSQQRSHHDNSSHGNQTIIAQTHDQSQNVSEIGSESETKNAAITCAKESSSIKITTTSCETTSTTQNGDETVTFTQKQHLLRKTLQESTDKQRPKSMVTGIRVLPSGQELFQNLPRKSEDNICRVQESEKNSHRQSVPVFSSGTNHLQIGKPLSQEVSRDVHSEHAKSDSQLDTHTSYNNKPPSSASCTQGLSSSSSSPPEDKPYHVHTAYPIMPFTRSVGHEADGHHPGIPPKSPPASALRQQFESGVSSDPQHLNNLATNREDKSGQQSCDYAVDTEVVFKSSLDATEV